MCKFYCKHVIHIWPALRSFNNLKMGEFNCEIIKFLYISKSENDFFLKWWVVGKQWGFSFHILHTHQFSLCLFCSHWLRYDVSFHTDSLEHQRETTRELKKQYADICQNIARFF